jgi:hypothetical protein
MSGFATLEIANGSTMSLASPALVHGQLITTGGSGAGNGRPLTVIGGLRVNGATIDNTDLMVQGGVLTAFDNVHFTGYAPSAPYQMSITAYGTFAMNNITFEGTPSAGNAWIKADVDPWVGNGVFNLSVAAAGCEPGYSAGSATVTFSFPACGGTVASQ